jgi:RimJ/RimL family protein N-acetyltransferase
MTPPALGPTLETERLILRPPSAADFQPMCAMMADEENARFIGGVAAPSQVWRQLCTMAGSFALYGYAMFSVVEKASGRWVGRVGPWMPADWPGPEVGWGLIRDVWGRGYATEAATASIDWAFDNLGWTEVIHCIEPDNLPSEQLALRLGSKRLRSVRMPKPFDDKVVDVWGQSREDWRRRSRAANRGS